MSKSLLICRSQTEALGLRRHLEIMGIQGEVTRPPRQHSSDSCGYAVRIDTKRTEEALHRLWNIGIAPCKVLPDEGSV